MARILAPVASGNNDQQRRAGRIGYESIVDLSKKLARPIHTLLALASGNDPFHCREQPARLHRATWFAELWNRLEFARPTHLRAFHYILVSQEIAVIGEDGEHYENTHERWITMCRASKDARYLNLVPAEDIEDNRADAPVEFLANNAAEADLSVENAEPAEALLLYTGHTNLPAQPDFDFTAPTVDQRYHVELWCEKSSDVLLSLARQYRLNYVGGQGEISVTHCHRLVERAKVSKRPVRILFVSDFDPTGMSIPLSSARKIEFFLRRDNLDLDIQVRPVALTHAQCVEYRLPRTPIKKTERRLASFETRYGEGATELDALEALRPGVLRRIMLREIARYHDAELDGNVEAEADAFRYELDDTRNAVLREHKAELDSVKRDHKELLAEMNEAMLLAKKRFGKRAAKIAATATRLNRTIAERLQEQAPDPAYHDWPEPEDGDEDDDPLFDSKRDYVEQIDRYKQHQGKSTTRQAKRKRK